MKGLLVYQDPYYTDHIPYVSDLHGFRSHHANTLSAFRRIRSVVFEIYRPSPVVHKPYQQAESLHTLLHHTPQRIARPTTNEPKQDNVGHIVTQTLALKERHTSLSPRCQVKAILKQVPVALVAPVTSRCVNVDIIYLSNNGPGLPVQVLEEQIL